MKHFLRRFDVASVYMVGKKLTSNLKAYLDPFFEIPVYSFDRNQTREVPCVIVGYENEEPSIKGVYGHYTVAGFVDVLFQGYEDQENLNADSVASQVVDLLVDRSSIQTALNKPLSGTDSRPLSGFGLNQLFVRGTKREELEHSTMVQINFEAFCVAKDF